MENIFISLHPMENGWTKATVYRNTNKYLFEVVGSGVNDCLRKIANKFPYVEEDALNDSLNRRAD